MKIPKAGSILSIAILGGLGYAAYKFAKGDWKLPGLGDLLGGIGIPTPDPQTLKETGIVGGAGDVIYNITYPGELRERATERVYLPREGIESATQEVKRIYADVGIIEPPDPGGVFARAVAMTVSEDIHEEGLGVSLLKSPVTIGAGLGAMFQQAKYYGTLPPDARRLAEKEESEKRMAFRSTPEGAAATAISTIFPPLAMINVVSTVIDAVRIAAPDPTPKPPAVWTPEPVPTVKEFATSPILDRLRVLKGLNR